MIRRRTLVSILVCLAVMLSFAPASVAQRNAIIKDQDHKGVPTFVTGMLGKLARNDAKAAKDFLKAQRELLMMTGTEDFEVVGALDDKLGQSHVKLRETLRGLAVIGAEYVVHYDRSGSVLAMNGRFVADSDLPSLATVGATAALQRATVQMGAALARFAKKPELVYVVNDQGDAFLAWRTTISYNDAEGPQLDIVYADATTGDLVLRDPQYKRARDRNTYTANYGTSLPGTLILTEYSAPTGDPAADSAHDYAGVTYDYYSSVHGRDSFDNAGASLVSTVHFSFGYNNAFWNGSQMVYGDGDGYTFAPLSEALDVDAHELTHAVTERTAGLIYSNESGALNEATSDILGNSVEAWFRGISANTWKVGEDVYTPGIPGDALRYMNDPALAGDYDYYPTRYTGPSDNGGVHWNSGIANLAYYLMVAGGTHPRGKTSVFVSPLDPYQPSSLAMAERIWYRALTVYMTSTTNFQGARNATAQAATDLYGATAAASVHKAWDAVGVPGTPGSGSSNPFTYVSGRDEFLACYGIAGRISSNCRDISDYNDKQMCYALSTSSQGPCTTMTDRNMQLACYGMSINYPSNCRDITDPNMRNLCYGESSQNYNYCYSITDRNAQLLCFAISNGVSSNCRDISNPNDRQFCYGISSHINSYCGSIQQ
jgi:Zn-dependent metalloprotease